MEQAILFSQITGSFEYLRVILENFDRILEDGYKHVPDFFCPLEFKDSIVSQQKKLDILMEDCILPKYIQDRIEAAKGKLKLFGERNRILMEKILRKKAIKSLKVDGQDSSERGECPVCMEDKLVVEMMETDCKHRFCLHCIWKCSMIHRKCPTCRKNIRRYPHFKSTEIYSLLPLGISVFATS